MRALTLLADRKLELVDVPAPPAPAAGEVQIAVKAIALNHLDLWGFRGMAFAKRKLPVVVGVEAAGEIAAVGAGVSAFKPGEAVVMYGALTCGTCPACREGRDNLCENVGGIMGFHVDGFARDRLNLPARLVIPVPKGVSMRDAACAPIGFATVEHMLFDNAKLKAGETILVQAGGSGIGTAAIKMAKAIGCTVITTVGDDA
jgi:alcohol dehydrogenase